MFAIPVRKSKESFDMSKPEDEEELAFGCLYCIFRIELVSDLDVDGEPIENELILIKVIYCIQI